MTGWGITVPLATFPPESATTMQDHAVWYPLLRQLGYTDLWSAEGGGPMDAFTPLTLASAWAPGMRLGVGVVSAFTRGPAILASTAAALNGLAPGKFALGIGSSSDVIVNRWNGIPFDKPYSRTRDVLRFLKAALDGERITEDFETFSVKGFRLNGDIGPRPPLLVAALRERMLRLAGTEGDGAILNWTAAEDILTLAPLVRATNPSAEIVDRIIVCPTEDREAVYRAVKPIAASYTVVKVYRAFHEWMGRGDLLGEAWEAWDAGYRNEAVAAIPDKVIDALCVHGSADACHRHLQRYIANGVSTPVIALLPVGVGLRESLELLAPRSLIATSSVPEDQRGETTP
jgi:probable F420-dependent oxidoreductase